MSKVYVPTALEIEQLDHFYREEGLREMAPPHVHYDDLKCPHSGCTNGMEWIDFKLELHGDPERIYKPLVRAWWEGSGFVGRCPNCHGWVRFTTLGMEAIEDRDATRHPQLPENWHTLAQFG